MRRRSVHPTMFAELAGSARQSAQIAVAVGAAARQHADVKGEGEGDDDDRPPAPGVVPGTGDREAGSGGQTPDRGWAGASSARPTEVIAGTARCPCQAHLLGTRRDQPPIGRCAVLSSSDPSSQLSGRLASGALAVVGLLAAAGCLARRSGAGKLARFDARPTVDIQVIPFDTLSYEPLSYTFTVLRFDHDSAPTSSTSSCTTTRSTWTSHPRRCGTTWSCSAGCKPSPWARWSRLTSWWNWPASSSLRIPHATTSFQERA